MAHFLFSSGQWHGSGIISFTMSPEKIPFKTVWTICAIDEATYRATQIVDIPTSALMTNVFIVRQYASAAAIANTSFEIKIENEVIGTFIGQGVYNDTKITWEFSHPGLLDGSETYQQVSKDNTEKNSLHSSNTPMYTFQSKYDGGDGFYTIIEGVLHSV